MPAEEGVIIEGFKMGFSKKRCIMFFVPFGVTEWNELLICLFVMITKNYLLF